MSAPIAAIEAEVMRSLDAAVRAASERSPMDQREQAAYRAGYAESLLVHEVEAHARTEERRREAVVALHALLPELPPASALRVRLAIIRAGGEP